MMDIDSLDNRKAVVTAKNTEDSNLIEMNKFGKGLAEFIVNKATGGMWGKAKGLERMAGRAEADQGGGGFQSASGQSAAGGIPMQIGDLGGGSTPQFGSSETANASMFGGGWGGGGGFGGGGGA